MITKAQWEVLMYSYIEYIRALESKKGKSLRLYVKMLDLVGSYTLPTDVEDALDQAVSYAYQDAHDNKPIRRFPIAVVYTAFDGTIIVDCLKATLQFA